MANLQLIRQLCERKKMTLRELAQRVDRNESSLQSAIRRGSTNSATIEAIAKVLGVAPGIFFEGFLDGAEAKEKDLEIEHLKAMLAEKERTIEILMGDRRSKK